jgi:hypothetical protein
MSACCLIYGSGVSLLFGDGGQIVNHFQKKKDVDAEMTMARTGGGRKKVQKEASNKRREAGRRRRDFLAELADRGCIHLGNYAHSTSNMYQFNTNNLRKSINTILHFFLSKKQAHIHQTQNKLGQPLSGLSFLSISGQSLLAKKPGLDFKVRTFFFSKLPPLVVLKIAWWSSGSDPIWSLLLGPGGSCLCQVNF